MLSFRYISSRNFHIGIALILALIAGFVAYKNLLRQMDLYLFDTTQGFTAYEVAEDILIVAIDEQSLDALGPWPWPRGHHAELIQQLTRLDVRNIAFDIIFSETSEAYTQGDEQLARQIASNKNIVLPVMIGQIRHQGPLLEITPTPVVYNANPSLGHVHVQCDVDSICRSVFLQYGLGKKMWPHLSVALLQQQNINTPLSGLRADHPLKNDANVIYRDYFNYLSFPKDYHRYKTVSYLDVLNGVFPDELFSGYTVFVGATAAGSGDQLATPVGLIPGVIFNAIIYQALRENKFVQEISSSYVMGVTSIIGFFLLLFLSRLSPLFFLLGSIATVLSIYVAMFVSTVVLHRWFPVAPLIALVLVYYPLWSWFKLQLALGYLKQRLTRINIEQLKLSPLMQFEGAKLLPARASESYGVDVVTKTVQQLSQVSAVIDQQHFVIDNTFAQLHEGVILASGSGRVLLANAMAQKFFDLAQDDDIVRLQNQVSFSSSEPWQNLNGFLDAVKRAKDGLSAELSLSGQHGINRDITILYCHAMATEFVSADSTSSSVLLFAFTDITDMKAVEKSRLDTLNFLSHDLRAPMVSILALLSNMRSGKNYDSLDVNLEKIKQYAESNLGFSESILRLSRAEEINRENFVPVDVHAVVDDAYYSISDVASSNDITLIVEREDNDFWVNGDAGLLERAVGNIIANAIKYCPSNTQVTIAIQTEQSNVRIDVRDQGPGIPESMLPALFERYKRGISQNKNTGAGLGLYFVKTVAEKHSGKVTVNSRLGKGTCFSLSLPLINID